MYESLRLAAANGSSLAPGSKWGRYIRRFLTYFHAFPLLVSPLLAQVTIRNPEHLEVPEQKVGILLHTTCQVVAREFHLPEKDVEFRLVLVLGDPNEHYTSDEEHQLYTLYLYRWNEPQFATSAMRLAIQHMVTQSIRDKLVKEILKRSNGMTPVSIKALQHHQ